MRRTTLLIALTSLIFAGSYLGKRALDHRPPGGIAGEAPGRARGSGRRIVSLAPSVTESLFVLGLGDRVVGVTRFCDYPPDARSKTKVGGYFDPNYEIILSLKPDLVIMLPEHEEQKRQTDRLGIPTLVLNQETVEGILDSITTIGRICGVEEKAATTVRALRERVQRVRSKTKDLPRMRVIVSIGRNIGPGALMSVYLAGRKGFYDEMIELAGGTNAYEGAAAFPVFSEEGIVRLNPDVVIDVVPDLEEHGWEPAVVRKEWEAVPRVNAVRNGRIYVFGQDYVAVPGPRFILILEEMARLIHPEADWVTS